MADVGHGSGRRDAGASEEHVRSREPLPPFRRNLHRIYWGELALRQRPSAVSAPGRPRVTRATLPASRVLVEGGVKPPRSRVSRRDLLRLRRAGGEPVASPTGAGARRGHAGLRQRRRPDPGEPAGDGVVLRGPARGRARPGPSTWPSRALDLIDDAGSPADRLSRRLRGQPAQRHGPPRAGRGRAGPVRASSSGPSAIGRATGGAYDVTAGALSVAWGFTRGPRRVPDPETLADARGPDRLAPPAARPRAADGRLRPARDRDQPGEHRQGVRDRPGRRRDPGPLVADVGPGPRRPVEPLRPRLAPRPASAAAGRSPCANPFDPESPARAILRCGTGGWGPRATAFQRFEAGGRVYGHILDPRTGEPGRRARRA